MSSVYSCQIQGCNLMLVVLGLASVGLAGSQFSRVGLENYRDIDLRLLNFFHVLTGFICFYCVSRSHGSIVAKTMYIVSIVFAISTAIFYGFTTYRIVDTYRQLLRLQNIQGFQQEYGDDINNHVGKIVISSVMIGVATVTALVSMVAVLILDKLVAIDGPPGWLTVDREQELELKYNLTQLTSVAIVKLILSLGTLGLAAFLEYEHELVGGRDNYIKIALDHIAAMLAAASAIVDLYAVFGKGHGILNLKVSIALSVIAAVWTLKSVDNGMFPFYKNDIRYYRTVNNLNEPSLSSSEAPKYIIVVVHGVLLGALSLLFVLATYTAILAGCCVRREAFSFVKKIPTVLKLQGRYLMFLHCFWASCLMALVLLGLCNLPWNGDFIGGDLLWQAVLFFATGVISSSNLAIMTTTKFVLNTVSLAVATEKTFVSINLIYQSFTFEEYKRAGGDTYTGRIVLNCCQCGVQFLAACTSATGAVLYGKSITRLQSPQSGSNSVHAIFSLGTLFYGIVMTGCYVVFELGRWRYSEAPIEVPYYRLANGPVAGAAFVVQVLCGVYPKLLLSTTILQLIVAALAMFVINSAITNVYYLQILLGADDILKTNDQNTILEIALILAAASTLACIIATFSSIISALRSSYLLHHRNPASESTAVMPLEDSFNTIASSPKNTAIQPMEEQTVYWSADENPYFYQTTRRFYSQPYNIDTGFYGYSRSRSMSPGEPMGLPRTSTSPLNPYDSRTNSVRSVNGGRRIQIGTQTQVTQPFTGRSEM